MVRTRIAPSPTGKDLHIGNVYTALFNFAFAKKHNGKFIIRIEDTDQSRLVRQSEKKILESLEWLGLKHNEGPYKQSKRLKIYKKYAEKLVKKGFAYYCFCSFQRLVKIRKEQQKKGLLPRYDRKCRTASCQLPVASKNKNYVIRLKVPKSGETSFKDIIRGKISFKNKLIDDQVLLKSDGFPTYHLAVVVDDYLMKITHIIRGEEWISSTPKHVLIYKFLGWDLPKFAHHPLLRNQKKQKLSKRRDPVWITWYKKQGFLKEALLNYLALMGWSMPNNKEIFSLKEFIKEFSLERISTSAPIFDLEKLEWMNGEYIRKTQNSNLKSQIYEFLERKYPEDLIEKTTPLIKERIKKLSEYLELCEFFFKEPKSYEKKINANWLKKVIKVFKKQTKWKHENLYKAIGKLAEKLEVSKSKFFMNIRIAVTGKKIGPPLFESLEILEKKETLARLERAILL